MATLVHQVSCLAVWPGSSELLGWFRLCGQGLVSCLDAVWPGSSQLLECFRLCGRGLVSCFAWMVQAVWPGSSQLLGCCVAGV